MTIIYILSLIFLFINSKLPEQRHEYHGQRVGLEACEQVREEHRQRVEDGARDNQVRGNAEVGIRMDKFKLRVPENEEAEYARAHVAEDMTDGDTLVEAAPADELRDLLFALAAVVRVALRKYRAEGALGRRERCRSQDKDADEYDGKDFGRFHYACSL